MVGTICTRCSLRLWTLSENGLITLVPSVSSGDSIDWKNPTSADIMKRVLAKAKSGSIILFHNDLDNTTAALPEILKQLKSDGYQMVGMKDLIYPDNYTIDSEGRQHPISESLLGFDEKEVEEVLAQYSDKLSAAGITDEQIAAAVAAIKSGEISALPQELQPIAAQVMAKISEAAENSEPDETSSSDETQRLK